MAEPTHSQFLTRKLLKCIEKWANNCMHQAGEHARFSEVTQSDSSRSKLVASATASR